MANQYPSQYYKYLRTLESEYNITLSYEARQMLLLPLNEYENLLLMREDIHLDIELKKWEDSLTKLIREIKHEPAKADSFKGNYRTSLSVIKAYASKFCNIPPFCGER